MPQTKKNIVNLFTLKILFLYQRPSTGASTRPRPGVGVAPPEDTRPYPGTWGS